MGAENAVVGVDLQRCQPIVARRDDRLRRVRGVDAVHLDLHAPSGSLVRCPQTLVVVARPPFEAGCVL